MQQDVEPLSVPPPTSEPEGERTGSRRAWIRARSAEVLRGLEGIRAQSRTVSAGFLIYERDREFPSSLLIGAVAVRLVIFLIPFLILVIFAIGVGADAASTDAASAAGNASLPDVFAQAAGDAAAASGGLRGFALLATAFATLWAANALGKTMQLAFAVVWRVPRRPPWHWFLPFAVIGFVVLSLGLNGLASRFEEPGVLDDLLELLLELVVISALWLVASRTLPHADGARWRDFLPGTLLVAIALVALRAAWVLYLVPKWNSLDARYGDIGVVLVMLSWAFIVAAAAVYSAHVNAALFSTGEGRPATSGPRVLPGFIKDQWRQLRRAEDSGGPG